MVLYLDTSALVKRYFREPFSDEILSKWQSAKQIVTSSVAYAETMASIYRKKRESDVPDALMQQVVQSVKAMKSSQPPRNRVEGISKP